MRNLQILDCTLRDGGYVNNWEFGTANINKIINKLIKAKIDIIEYGFLNTGITYDPQKSIFDNVERISPFIPQNRGGTLSVVLSNYDELDTNKLPVRQPDMIDGIRVAFHKKNMKDALDMCDTIKEKGYKVFLQPMVSVSYTDEEFLGLIKASNAIEPYAFYIVDSFGMMKQRELIRMFYLADNNLNKDIRIGFHSHNNMQLSFANAQMLLGTNSIHDFIIDSSVFGMGRGAGNLNTELLADYVNDTFPVRYDRVPLLQIIDEVISPIYMNNYWGFSLPYYLSALHNCHPNYASYLDDKSTLTVENMNDILNSLEEERKTEFDKKYIEEMYIAYQGKQSIYLSAHKELRSIFEGKTVFLIAPGKSTKIQHDKIVQIMRENPFITVSVNFIPEDIIPNYVFVSNRRRYNDIQINKNSKLILTSNLNTFSHRNFIVDYNKLTNDIESVMDNSGMMMIKLLILTGAKKVLLAGIDGYSHDINNNFSYQSMEFMKKRDVMELMNKGMSDALKLFSKNIEIDFVTDPQYVHIN